MTFIEDTKKVLANYQSAYTELTGKRMDLQDRFKRDRISGSVYAESKKELDAQFDELYKTTQADLWHIFESYRDSLSDRYAVTSDRVNQDDLALMGQDLVKLSADDLTRMFEKYRAEDNVPMMEAVRAYEDKAQTGASLTFFSRAQREGAAERYIGGCMASIQDIHGLQFGYYASAAAVPPELQGE